MIGYMGHTGYSTTENVNNIEVTHLHWGLELVFDEEQKESDNEISDRCLSADLFSGKTHAGSAESRGNKRVDPHYKNPGILISKNFICYFVIF